MRFFERLHRRLDLFWKVFFANLALMAVLALAVGYAVNRGSDPVSIAVLVVALLGVALLDYLVVRLATLPFRVLSGVIDQVALGDAHVQAPLQAADPDVRKVAHVVNRLVSALAKERQDFTRRIFLAQEEERRQIAQRLHDEAVQTLALQQIHLDLLGREANLGAAREKLHYVSTLGETAIRDLREVIRDIRPAALDVLGLFPAISALLGERAEPFGVATELDLEPGPMRLPPHVETAVFRTVQEAVHNALRHAGAKHLKVSTRYAKGGIEIRVVDDGRGVTAEDLAHPGLGIAGMRERMALLGGRLDIKRGPTGGTSVLLWIPTPEGGERS